MRALVLCCAWSLAVAAPVFAQAPGQTPPRVPIAQPERPAPHERPAKETKRERVKKRIRTLRTIALTEELGLDSDGAGKLFPLLARYDDEFDRLLGIRGQLQRRLDGAADLKDKKAIDKLIDDSLANQRDFWNLEEKRIAELRKILTPEQVARVLVVLPALERKIQNQLRAAVRPNGPGAKRGAGADPDDDDVERDEQPAAPPARPAPRGNPTPTRPDAPAAKCDPFSSKHGC